MFVCVCVYVSHNVSCVIFILDKGVVKPDELFMLSDHRELILLEVGQCALCVRGWKDQSMNYKLTKAINLITCVARKKMGKQTLVWTVNLTLSLSLRASEMSTWSMASFCRSTFTALGWWGQHIGLCITKKQVKKNAQPKRYGDGTSGCCSSTKIGRHVFVNTQAKNIY